MISLRDIVDGTQGRLRASGRTDLLIRNARHDSRDVQDGDLFVALKGERVDGHQFVIDAFQRGAVAALIDETHEVALQDAPGHLVILEDTIAGLQRLAAYWRRLFNLEVIGITGSIGKSSTKEVVAAIVGQRCETLRSRGNFNNEIGLPLTLLEITPDTEAVVLEMGGAYAFDEIKELCDIAPFRETYLPRRNGDTRGRSTSTVASATTRFGLNRSVDVIPIAPPLSAARFGCEDSVPAPPEMGELASM